MFRLAGVLSNLKTRSNKAPLVSECMQYGFIGMALVTPSGGSGGNRNVVMT